LLVTRTRSPQIADGALSLLISYRRDQAVLLVPTLVQQDPSWITRSPLSTYLHKYRQDLLTPFLGQQAYKGHFSTGKTRFVLPISDGFVRWTRQQQAIFERTLVDVILDTTHNQSSIISAVMRLAALPALPGSDLIALASDERMVV